MTLPAYALRVYNVLAFAGMEIAAANKRQQDQLRSANLTSNNPV